MARWFTSDLHFGHSNIIRYSGCPFADTGEMNEALIDRWNAVVGNGDEVWVLGDVALGGWLIHGHVHEKWRQRGRQINIGADAWGYTPVHEDTIAELINQGPQHLERFPMTSPDRH